MKSVLISINPKWCELIASGKKTVEVRKTIPKLETPFKVYIYQTKESKRRYTDHRFNSLFSGKSSYDTMGKVIGEFICNEIERFCQFILDPQNHYEQKTIDEILKLSCLSYDELCKYIAEREYYKPFYLWHISNLVIYEKPRELSEFFHFCGDNPKCDGCEAHYFSNTECGKEDYCCSPIEGCKPIKRPPQSWCYVERSEE